MKCHVHHLQLFSGEIWNFSWSNPVAYDLTPVFATKYTCHSTDLDLPTSLKEFAGTGNENRDSLQRGGLGKDHQVILLGRWVDWWPLHFVLYLSCQLHHRCLRRNPNARTWHEPKDVVFPGDFRSTAAAFGHGIVINVLLSYSSTIVFNSPPSLGHAVAGQQCNPANTQTFPAIFCPADELSGHLVMIKRLPLA